MEVLDLKGRLRCRGCGQGAGGGSDQVAGAGGVTLSGVEVPKVPAARHGALGEGAAPGWGIIAAPFSLG